MAGAHVRRGRRLEGTQARRGLAAGILSVAAVLAGVGAAQGGPAGQDGGLDELYARFQAAYSRYRSDPAARAAAELELIEAGPPLLDALARAPEIPADRAWYTLTILLYVEVDAAGSAREAAERVRLGERMHAFALDWGAAEQGGTIVYFLALERLKRGRLKAADAMLASTLEAYPDTNGVTPQLHMLRAEIRRADARWEDARRCLAEAEEAIEAVGWDPGSVDYRAARADVLGRRGQLEVALGLPDRAAAAFEQERALAEALAQEDPRLESVVGNATARRMELYLLLERFERILAEVPPVLELDIDPTARDLLELQHAVALAELAEREPERAPRARAELEALLAEGRVDGVEAVRAEHQLAVLALVDDRFEDAQALLAASGARLADVSAERSLALEAAYQRALEARTARLAGAPEPELAARLATLRAACDGLLATWAEQPLSPDGIGFLQVERRRAVVGEVIALCMELPDEGGEAAVELVLRAQANGTLSRRLKAGVPTLAELRTTLLADGAGALLYHQSGFESHLLAVDAQGVAYAALPPIHVIDALYFELRDLVTAAPDPADEDDEEALAEIDAWARALGEVLLPGDVRRRARGWSHVIVSDANQIGDVPWECLPLTDEEPLGLAKPLSYLPSLPLGMHLARRAGPAEARYDLLLFAMPPPGAEAVALEPRLGPLPIDDPTLGRLTGAFPAERVRAWVGPAATRTALAAAPLGDALALHLFCHGVPDPGRARPAALVLADDGDASGLLGCEDVEALAGAMPPLVVLSACGAARGPRRAGEDGVTHLGGAYLYAGAQVVVLASASVEYAATVALMEVFHRELAAGESVAHALWEARRAVARERPHPYHHALLRVVGLGGRTLVAAREPR